MDASAIALRAGLVGAGGAGFPTHVKLAAKADCLIINAAECEPLIEVDKFLIRTRADDLVSGALDMALGVGAKRVVFAIKKAYKTEIACLDKAIAAKAAPGGSSTVGSSSGGSSSEVACSGQKEPEISVFGMRSFYPAGDEQLIVKLLTGKSVPERGIPLDVGTIVDNVATVINFFDAALGKPVTHRILSVTGAVNDPLMLRVPIGTNVGSCIEAAGGCADGSTFIMGGPMMGAYYDLPESERLSIKKTDGNILVLPPGHKLYVKAKMDMNKLKNRARAACIRCRMCTDLCPRYLTGHDITPHVVMQNFFRIDSVTDNTEFEKAFGSALNCSECGVCENYACPMMLSPRRVNAFVKPMFRERGIDTMRNMKPEARDFFEQRLVPTARLTARLGLTRYVKHLGNELLGLEPAGVTISLRQHIGAPCIPCVSQGARVKTGDLIAIPPEGKLGANLHASIDGVVIALGNEAITIGSE